MTKVDFITRLNRAIDVLPYEDRKEILADYEEHFRVGFDNGKTESEICETLGVPEELAADYYAEGSNAPHSQDASYYDANHPFFVAGQGGAYVTGNPKGTTLFNEEALKKVLKKALAVFGTMLFVAFCVLPVLVIMIGLFMALLIGVGALCVASFSVIAAALSCYPNGNIVLGGILVAVGVLAAAALVAFVVFAAAKGLFKAAKYFVKACIKRIKKA
jgi:uncharacterized membrane protein